MLRETNGGTHLHLPRRRDHLHHPHRDPLPGRARLRRHARPARPRPRHLRPRRPLLLGSVRLQEAGHDVAVPVAPGQRLRVPRPAALPHVLDRAHRRHRGQRVPVGRARPAPARHLRTTSSPTSASSASPTRPRPVSEPVPVEVAAGDIVVLSTLTPHCTGANETEPRPQELHRPVRARRRRRGQAGGRRLAQPHARRRPRSASSPILVDGRPVPVAPLPA